MSFAGPVGQRREGKKARILGMLPGGGRRRSRSGEEAGPEAMEPGAAPPRAPRRAMEEPAWTHAALLGTGIFIGAVLGAGVALLYAPQSGLQTRAAIRRRGRHLATRGHDAWDELADELRKTARRRLKGMRRRGTQARWAAEDWRDERGW